MKTMTMYEIYRRAYYNLLDEWDKENRVLTRRLIEEKPVRIVSHRVEELGEKLQELAEMLTKMEEGKT